MKRRIDWDLILSYLDGDYSENEEKLVLEWAAESKKNKDELELLKMIWASSSLELPRPNVEKALQNIKERINSLLLAEETKNPKIINFKNIIGKGRLPGFLVSSRLLKIAAVVVIFIAGAVYISNMLSNKKLKEITVGNKLIKEIMLPDGTKVTLDAGSILKYREELGNNDCEVFLNGEGYFEVTPDKGRQFIVHTNLALITVLGTKFNVRAWEQNNKELVAVVDGKVRFGSENTNNSSSGVIIRKGQMSSLENGLVSSPIDVNVDKQLSWMHREMKFQSTSLGEVLGQLGRWYDLEFILPDDSYKAKIITIYIEKKPLEDILEVISLIMRFKYEKNANSVKFLLRQ
jgi:ferric-dicitrate binding protein FerR (iron transport regulator)